MSDRLSRMFKLQDELQEIMPPRRAKVSIISDPDEIIQFIKDQKLALEAELQEALDEVGWKPWASKKYINTDAFKSELVDMWHFFMNLCLVIGLTPEELYQLYLEKREKNLARQEAGYDGVSTKCPVCHRALDDTFVLCDPVRGYCEMFSTSGITHEGV